MENRVDVLIDGKVVTLKSTESEEYLHRLARYIDKKITDTTSASKTSMVDERTRTLLIALNVADDYFKSVEGVKELETMHKKILKEMERMQKENTTLQSKIKSIEADLETARKEFDEFVNSFDEKEAAEKSKNILHMPESRKAAR